MAVTSSFSQAEWPVRPATTTVAASDRLASLDAMRGLAALLVVLMHGREFMWIGMAPYLRAFPFDFSPNSLLAYALAPLISGAIGVSLLFVISGYVIHRPQALALVKGAAPFDARAFYLRRFVRIYPTLVLALAVTAICDAIAARYAGHPALGTTSGWTLAVNLASLQGVLAQPFGSNSPLWSLAIEVQFYLFYPLALMLRRRLGADAMAIFAVALSLLGIVTLHRAGMTAFPQYFLAWWIGAYIADREIAGRGLPHRWPVFSGLAIVCGSVAYQLEYCYAGLMLWALGLAPMLTFALQRRFGWLSGNELLKGIGQFSYTLYAIHFPIIVLLATLVLGGARQPNIFLAMGLTGIAIAVSYGAYWLAEWPSVRLLTAMRQTRDWRQMGGVAAPALAVQVRKSFSRVADQPRAWTARAAGIVSLRANVRKVAEAAACHPVFQPPHIAPPAQRTTAERAHNFAYFNAQRSDRIAHLSFLLAKFSASARSTADVDRFVAGFGPSLLPTPGHVLALETYTPGWSGGLATLNVVHDLGVWTGELVMARNHRWQWAVPTAAEGNGAILTDGVRRIDVVAEVARCVSCPVARASGLRNVRTLFGLD